MCPTYTKHGDDEVIHRFRFAIGVCIILAVSLVVSVRTNATPETRRFTIIQFNDVYEVFPLLTLGERTTELRGGLAYAGTLIAEARSKGQVLVLHAGDFLSPSLLSIRFGHKGKQMIDAMNALGIDFATLGNHEFDFGCKVLAERISESRFSYLISNIEFPRDLRLPEDRVKSHRIIEIAGLRIGIFGLTEPMQSIEDCAPSSIQFGDPFRAAAHMMRVLKRERVDMIVALTHQRIEQDRRLAEMFPDIELIVGGHDHEPMVEVVGQTLITKAGSNALSLGTIEVKARREAKGWTFMKAWKPKPVDPDILQPDAKVVAALAPYDQQVKSLQQVVGRTEVALDVREATVREKESNFGNYLTDLMRDEMQADIALLNGGALRGDRILPPGPLTLHDLYSVLLFDNQLLAVQITGEEVQRALENGVSLTGETSGRFPQISGMRFSYDPSRPPGQRVLSAFVGNQPLDPKRTYTMATTDFLINRGKIDGYVLPKNIMKSGSEIKELVVKNLEHSPIRCATEGRILETMVAGAQAPKSNKPNR